MHIGHTHGDVAYLKQGRDHILIPVTDNFVMSATFAFGSYYLPIIQELNAIEWGMDASSYELVIFPTATPAEYNAMDWGMDSGLYESVVVIAPLQSDAHATVWGMDSGSYDLVVYVSGPYTEYVTQDSYLSASSYLANVYSRG